MQTNQPDEATVLLRLRTWILEGLLTCDGALGWQDISWCRYRAVTLVTVKWLLRLVRLVTVSNTSTVSNGWLVTVSK